MGKATRLVFFGPSDLRIPRVDRQGVVNFCDALQQIGVDVEAVSIAGGLHEREQRRRDPLTAYRIRRPFPVRLMRAPVWQDAPDLWLGAVRLAMFTWRGVVESLRARSGTETVLLVKNYGVAAGLLLARLLSRSTKVVFEAHVPPPGRLHAWVLRRCDRVLANSFALGSEIAVVLGPSGPPVLGLQQGIDVGIVDELRVTKDAARLQLGLPRDQFLAVYTGKVYWGYREIELIVDAARRARDVTFVIVGGRPDHVEKWRHATRDDANILFTGFVPPADSLAYQFAADTLLLYYPSGIALNAYRSPAKLFEYMAAGAPIVAADLPVLREVLGEPPAAIMVPQDDPVALADAVRSVHRFPDRASALAARAGWLVREFTWVRRAHIVMDFVRRGSAVAVDVPRADRQHKQT